jgi:predicted nuclease of restriction endonuclease-like (RecB) superfamily
MERFLLELGSGFSFVARQKRIASAETISTLTLSFITAWLPES